MEGLIKYRSIIYALVLVACFISNNKIVFAESPPMELEFKDEQGNITKKIPLPNRQYQENGRRMEERAIAVKSKNGKTIIVMEGRGDIDNKNPYTMRFSSSTTLTWYDAKGDVKCKKTVGTFTTLRSPIISDDGSTVILIDVGFDPVSFELYNDVPGLKSTEPLKQDTSLTATHLHILNEKCETIYSTTTLKGGWQTIMLSPSAKWLVLQEGTSGEFIEGKGWKYFLNVINLQDRHEYIVDWDRDITPKEINDNGTIIGRKYLGRGALDTYIDSKGKENKAYRSRIQMYEWRPGLTAFEKRGGEREEQDWK